jgi:hypothetical protein
MVRLPPKDAYMGDLEHSPGWIAANRALWLVGTAVVAAHALALFIYGPGIRVEAEETAQRQMMAEHEVICDKLGKQQANPDRERCLILLLQLQQRHEQAYVARTTDLF